ncbi:MAG: class I tRNA ligase family protein [Candidatus Liptonbacteria bacterium]|nr:class I tRNA ligase family protein [Candidatus Liptonbacteria bacterium]
MTRKYDFGKVERKWQEVWEKEKTYEPDFKNVPHPFYNLMMFPYPSAEGLHIGGVRTFTGVDIYGRLKRMQGHDVFEPMGLDGFGIHSENYALKIGAHPASQAKVSEKRFYEQLAALGNGFAWDEKLETYAPEYYKWTQWISIQLFKRGLAYRKKQPVNWCPSCKTVLADEQVIQKRQGTSDKEQGNAVGVCERCETPVIKKELEQWFFKTTAYAERLLKNLDTLDWSENVKTAQKNWIGRSEGALIKFPIINFQLRFSRRGPIPFSELRIWCLRRSMNSLQITNYELRITRK